MKKNLARAGYQRNASLVNQDDSFQKNTERTSEPIPLNGAGSGLEIPGEVRGGRQEQLEEELVVEENSVVQGEEQSGEQGMGECPSLSLRASPISFGGRKPIGSYRATCLHSEYSMKVDDQSERKGSQMSQRQQLESTNGKFLELAVTEMNEQLYEEQNGFAENQVLVDDNDKVMR